MNEKKAQNDRFIRPIQHVVIIKFLFLQNMCYIDSAYDKAKITMFDGTVNKMWDLYGRKSAYYNL